MWGNEYRFWFCTAPCTLWHKLCQHVTTPPYLAVPCPFPKDLMPKAFLFLFVLMCYKHPFLRKWQRHLIQPHVHHYRPALHGSATLRDPDWIFSLTTYSFGDLKGFLYDSRYKTHRYVWFHLYLTHKWNNYFKYWWEKATSGSKPRNFTGGNKSSLSNLRSRERTAVKCHLQHLSARKTLAQLSELAVTLEQGKEKALTPRLTDIQTYSLKVLIPDMTKRPLFFLLVDILFSYKAQQQG